MVKKIRIAKLMASIIAVLFLLNIWGGRERLYYIPSEKLYISVCLSPISNHYYLFFSKDGDSDAAFATNWIKCRNDGSNQFLTLQFDSTAPDYVYNWIYNRYSASGFSRKAQGSDIIYIQGRVESIMEVHSESLRFMLFNPVEGWSGPREFPEYNIGDYPFYNNQNFELLMYDDSSSDDAINIIKMVPIWSKWFTKVGWIHLSLHRGLTEL